MADLLKIQKLLENVADEIAADHPSKDGYRLERCADELFDLLMTRRREQREFAEALYKLARTNEADEWSKRVGAPVLRLVTDDEFEQMAYPNGREAS